MKWGRVARLKATLSHGWRLNDPHRVSYVNHSADHSPAPSEYGGNKYAKAKIK